MLQIALIFIIFFLAGVFLKMFWSGYDVVQKWVSKYLFFFSLPLLVAVTLSQATLSQFFRYTSVVSIFYIVIPLVFFLVIKFLPLTSPAKGSTFLCTVYGNHGLLGLAIISLFLGQRAIALGSVNALIEGISHFSLGIFLANLYVGGKKSALLRFLKTPLIYGFLAAFLLAKFSIPIPQFLKFTASLTGYFAVFVIGLSLTFQAVAKKALIYSFLLKHALMPILAIGSAILVGFCSDERMAWVLLGFTSPALINTPLANEYGFDAKHAASFTTLSTILFLIGVFIFFGLLR